MKTLNVSRQMLVVTGICLSILFYVIIRVLTARGALLFQLNEENKTFLSRGLLLIYLFLIFIYVSKVEKQNLFLWPETNYSFIFYIISVFCLVAFIFIGVGMLVNIEVYFRLYNENRQNTFTQILRNNRLLLIVTLITAGVMEELVFRAYLLPRLTTLLKNPYLAIIASSLLFGAAHYSYHSWSQVINAFAIGVIFAWYYFRYRNIKVLMVAHFLVDFISIVLTR